MKKSIRMMYSILSLILMNIVFWLCNYYPRHIIEWGSVWSIVAIPFNIIYFILNNYILIAIFKENKAPFFDRSNQNINADDKKIYFRNISILLGIQLAFEILDTLCVRLFATWSPISTDLLIIAHWMVIYAFLTKRNDKIISRHNKTSVMILAFVLLLGASIAFDINTTLDYLMVEEKYQPLSPYIMRAIANTDFIYGVKSLIFESGIAVILTMYHFACVESDECRNKKENKFVMLRVSIMLFGAVIICALKAIIYPYNSIKSFNLATSENKYYEEKEALDFVTKTFTVYRMSGRSDVIACYQLSNTKIYDDDMCISEFDWINLQKDHTVIGNQISIRDRYEELTIDGKKVCIIEDSVFCFFENNIPKVVKLYELESYEESDTAIKLCEQLILDGNMLAFEYGCEYLLKYDEDFIAPYIERYSNGDFNANELRWMSSAYYNSKYIQTLANNLRMH